MDKIIVDFVGDKLKEPIGEDKTMYPPFLMHNETSTAYTESYLPVAEAVELKKLNTLIKEQAKIMATNVLKKLKQGYPVSCIEEDEAIDCYINTDLLLAGEYCFPMLVAEVEVSGGKVYSFIQKDSEKMVIIQGNSFLSSFSGGTKGSNLSLLIKGLEKKGQV